MSTVLVEAARLWLVGTRRTFTRSGHDITVTVAELDAGVSPLGLVAGRLEHVKLVGTDIEWPGGRLTQAALTCHHMRVWPGPPPQITVSTGPIEWEAAVSERQLRGWLSDALPHRLLSLQANADGRLHAFVRSAPRLGRVELQPLVTEDGVVVRPVTAVLGRWRRRLRWRRVYPVRVPLPAGFTITAVEPEAGQIVVKGMLSPRRLSVSPVAWLLLLASLENGSEPVELSEWRSLG